MQVGGGGRAVTESSGKCPSLKDTRSTAVPSAVDKQDPHQKLKEKRRVSITEPARLEPVLCNKRGRDSERPAHHDEEWPPLATTGESPHTETKTQHSHK